MDVPELSLELTLELIGKPGYDICMATTKRAPRLRPNVCMLVYNRKGQLFLGERLGKFGHWQFPQGGVERGSSLKENVLRELCEELGLTKRQISVIKKLRAVHSYLWKRVPAYAKGRWAGQRQSFWLVEFVGRDSEIDIKGSKEPEFARWRWCSVRTVKRLAAKERLPGYEQPLKEFAEFWAGRK